MLSKTNSSIKPNKIISVGVVHGFKEGKEINLNTKTLLFSFCVYKCMDVNLQLVFQLRGELLTKFFWL